MNLPVLSALMVVFMIMLWFIYYTARNSSQRTSEELSMLYAREISAQVNFDLSNTIKITQSLARSFIAQRNTGHPRRELGLQILHNVAKDNPGYLSVWTMWEKNMFDGKDQEYASRHGQKHGLFTAAVFRNNGILEYQNHNATMGIDIPALVSDDDLDDYDRDFYTKCREEMKSVLINPYLYSFTGKDEDKMMMISVVSPVISQGQFLGVVGVDIDFEGLRKTNQRYEITSKGSSAIISSDSIILAHPNNEYIARNFREVFYQDTKLGNNGKANGLFISNRTFSPHHQQRVFRYFFPIQIGEVETSWIVMIEKPEKEVFAFASKLLIIIAQTGVVSFIMISIIVYLLSRYITRPIHKTVSFAREIATGNFRTDLSLNRDDELGQLQIALKDMAEKLEAYHNRMEYLVMEKTDQLAAANEDLEELNQELTVTNEELQTQHEQLEHTLTHLKQIQDQMVQSEKMASLGILTSGIAHELNNPLNFISSGIAALEMEINELVGKIKNYQADQSFDPSLTLKTEKHDGDLNIILENIPRLFDSIHTGIDRSINIVKGLRTFSRMDKGIKRQANLAEIIDSTLTILFNHYKNRITVKIDIASDLTLICYPEKLGQMFMNLLMNAIDAIESTGEILIKGRFMSQKKEYEITISDTGSGIPHEMINSIFDPFFTTKSTGKGTGLGLSIAFGIVKDHNGRINVESQMGKGTTFSVYLPQGVAPQT